MSFRLSNLDFADNANKFPVFLLCARVTNSILTILLIKKLVFLKMRMILLKAEDGIRSSSRTDVDTLLIRLFFIVFNQPSDCQDLSSASLLFILDVKYL